MNKGFICMTCGKNKVKRFTKKCEECALLSAGDAKQYEGLSVLNRQPFARIVTDEGAEVYVDKNGKEVADHGYDLEKDPRGWKKTGTQRSKRTII